MTALRNASSGSHFVTPIARLRQSTGHTDWSTCAVCGEPLDETKRKRARAGRVPDYCSPACRQKAYRLRKAGEG